MAKLLSSIIESCEECDNWESIYGTGRAYCNITNNTLSDITKIDEGCTLPDAPPATEGEKGKKEE